LLYKLSACEGIIPIITLFRVDDQVVVVMPHIEHRDFREYFHLLDNDGLHHYLYALFTALHAVHSRGIIHRDIKPANFLYHPDKRLGVLVDFGLAEKVRRAPEEQHRQGNRVWANINHAKEREGFYMNDPRPSFRANRNGTRGFRAPEVLMKVTQQTTALDIWSVGVILLSCLTGKFPFFKSDNDAEALAEIAILFGRQKLSRVATRHDREFHTNLPSVTEHGFRLEMLCKKLAKVRNKSLDVRVYDLLKRCLDLEDKTRITAEQALQHPFLRAQRQSSHS